MGTSGFAAEILRRLAQEESLAIVAVYTKSGSPAGRGRHKAGSVPVAGLAEELGIDIVRTPVGFTSGEETRFLQALEPDAGVVAEYGLLLPGELLRLPRHGFLNAHPSLLPRWRGAAPIERAIMAGDLETGVCIMQMSEALDEGGIYCCERVAIRESETAGELRKRLALLSSTAMVRVLDELRTGRAYATPQTDESACYAPKLKKSEGRVDWRLPAGELYRRIRACTPAPGAWFEAENGERCTRIGILRARPVPRTQKDAVPGELLDDVPRVACGDGALELLQLQREGRKGMSAAAFLRGFPLPPGSHLPLPE